jgi:hypothetical protein
MKYAIMLTVDTSTGMGTEVLLEAIEAGYTIMNGTAVGSVIWYVLAGKKELSPKLLNYMVAR